ncbi:MAG: phosphoesterase [Desulfurivibrio sp.]|nr:phosphoesterase [Desulfurivibrio sp.]
MKEDEQVFCLARTNLADLMGAPLPQGGFVGPRPEELLVLPQYFLARRWVEDDPAYKQLIPYQLFCSGHRYFVYRRGGGVGEGRLAGRLSVGIGGHINRHDAGGDRLTTAAYQQALLRERQEELQDGAVVGESVFIGWLNDEASPVGQVHLGAVHLGRLSEAQARQLAIRGGDEDIHRVGWLSAAEISAQKENFELWSLLAVELAEQQDVAAR